MSWLEILKKNDKEFETGVENKPEEEETIDIDIENHLILKDADDEFDRLYLSKITEIKCELQDYLRDSALPFLDKLNLEEYGFYEFIRENSYNYYEITDIVNKENEDIINIDNEINEDELYDSLEY